MVYLMMMVMGINTFASVAGSDAEQVINHEQTSDVMVEDQDSSEIESSLATDGITEDDKSS